MWPRGPAGPVGCGWGRSGPPGTSQGRPSASEAPQMAHFAQPARVPRESSGLSEPFGRQPELGLLGRRSHSGPGRLCYDGPRRPNSGWRPNAAQAGVVARNPVGEITEMGHLRRLGGRWSALGGAWPDPKGPGRCLPTPWVPWVRAVPIGPLRWPGGRSRGPESAVLPSGPWPAPSPFGHVRVPCDRPRCLSCPWPVPTPPGVLPGRWSGLGAVALV